MPDVSGIVETCLYVDDPERASAFYCDVIGLARLEGNGRYASLRVGERQVLLLFRKGGTLSPVVTGSGVIPPHDADGRQHLAFAIGGNDLDAWRELLRGKGVVLESEVRWPRGGTSLYFRDPDNHLVELATPGLWAVY